MTPPPSRPVRVLYIGGYGRSGSTLLDRILGAAPGVASLGEVRHLWREGLVENRRCGCGEPFRDCEYWPAVLADAFGPEGPDVARLRELQDRVDRWWRVPLLARRRESGGLREYADALTALYRSAAAVSGARVLVDSSKDISHGYVLRHLHPDIDVRVLHLVRDPRAVAYSWLRHKDNPGSGRPMDRWPAWRTALEWDVINAGVGALRHLGRPYLRVGYEQLTDDPAATVRRVLEFAGADAAASPVGADRSVLLTPSHTAAGNPDRFRSGRTQIAGDAAWRAEMRRRDRLAVTALCAPALTRSRRSASGLGRGAARVASALLIGLGALATLSLGPTRSGAVEQRILHRLEAVPQATWLVGGAPSQAASIVHDAVGAARGRPPTIVVYDLPDRDCGGQSAGGATDAWTYRRYVAAVAAALHRTAARVVLEPDSLAGIDCLTPRARATRIALLRWATGRLAQPGVRVYLDGGHAGWQPATVMAHRLVEAGVARARGFALNVSSFDSTRAEARYGRHIAARVGWKRFVIDTSRNGAPHVSGWCNPAGAALGVAPGSAPPDPLVDVLLWIKRPGESDGRCGASSEPAGRFDPALAASLARHACALGEECWIERAARH